MEPITIAREEKEDAAFSYFEGTLNNFPGWTFEAIVSKEIAWDSDVWTNHACTRITDVSIHENGKSYISIPGDQYDGHDIPVEPIHEEMLEQIDRHFGPSPKERTRLSSDRDADRDRVFEGLSEYIELHLQDASPVAIERAADKLTDVYEEKSNALEKMKLAAQERDAERGVMER